MRAYRRTQRGIGRGDTETEMLGVVIAGAIAVLLILVLALGADAETGPALSRADTEQVDEIYRGILAVQPRLRPERLRRIAGEMVQAEQEYGIPAKIQVGYVMRESSYDESIESLRKIGAAGEVGLTQVQPRHLRLFPELIPPGCSARLPSSACQIRAGASIHAYWREKCGPGASAWVYTAAYGMGRCPTEAEARRFRGSLAAFRYYRQAGWDTW